MSQSIFLNCQRIFNCKFEGLSIDFAMISNEKGLISVNNPFEDSDLLLVKKDLIEHHLRGDILIISGYPCFLVTSIALQVWANYEVIAIYDPVKSSALIVMSEDERLLAQRIPDELFFQSPVDDSLQNYHR